VQIIYCQTLVIFYPETSRHLYKYNTILGSSLIKSSYNITISFASFLSLDDAMKSSHDSLVDTLGIICHVGMIYQHVGYIVIREVAIKDNRYV
jgi:hypothetical protein